MKSILALSVDKNAFAPYNVECETTVLSIVTLIFSNDEVNIVRTEEFLL